MNAIRQTALLNKRELENAVPPSASWHADYRDTAYVYIGGLPLDLSEGDVVTIFSQYGNPTHLNLIRDKETGKSKGFGFLKYEDQRSCDLAVDNLGGADVLGRLLRVDHTRYKKREGEDEETYRIDRLEDGGAQDTDSDGAENGRGEGRRKRRKVLREEAELGEMLKVQGDGEDEDPMRAYLIEEKKEEVDRAREKDKRREHKHRHRHRHREAGGEDDEERRARHKARRRDRSRSEEETRTRRREDDGEKRQRSRRQSDERQRRHSSSRSPDKAQHYRRERDSRSVDSDDGQRRKRRSRSPRRRDD